MRRAVSKAVIGGLMALSLGMATLVTSEPASAQWRGGGWHGGGWRAGPGWGWHGGGWHGGGWGWRGGWGGRGYWGGNGWRWGPAIAAGALTAGAIAASSYPYYGYGYNSCWQVRPVYDAYGNYIGQSTVNVCY